MMPSSLPPPSQLDRVRQRLADLPYWILAVLAAVSVVSRVYLLLQ